MWLVNPARACPDNFGAMGTGYYRPVITFEDHAVINVTFGVVEHSHLITAGEFKTGVGMRTSKSIAIIPLDVEFDLAWAFWCEVLGQPELSSPAVSNNYVNFGTTLEQVDKRGMYVTTQNIISAHILYRCIYFQSWQGQPRQVHQQPCQAYSLHINNPLTHSS